MTSVVCRYCVAPGKSTPSDATVSAHAAALRGAGLITTVRAGRTVLHRRTP
ncbi:winged helix-turn-helix domain-containing protein [Streptomyces sp. NPDC020412]|uniref:winged helix-turn-helix domain-containing protein n=1 Tax=Streptomyces sp. NPDC020412 TaxID=3365073 RepID=UPI0037BA3D06